MSNVLQQKLFFALQWQQEYVQQAADFLIDNGDNTKEELLNGYKLKARLHFCVEEIKKIDNSWMKLLQGIKDDEKLVAEQELYENCANTNPDPLKIPYLVALHKVEDAIFHVETKLEFMERGLGGINKCFAMLKMKASIHDFGDKVAVEPRLLYVENEAKATCKVVEDGDVGFKPDAGNTVSPYAASCKTDDDQENADAVKENLHYKAEEYAQPVEKHVPVMDDAVNEYLNYKAEEYAQPVEKNVPDMVIIVRHSFAEKIAKTNNGNIPTIPPKMK
uniref:Uncharacterized protein n=1 Tax=Panagrolaimus sp. ES5 TaxID=591445 RepID=A0AC34GRR1_9BILA